MSVLNLLARMESVSVSLVPSKKTTERTIEIPVKQEGSLGSLSSLKNNQDMSDVVAEEIQLTTVCRCGYRRPFCACGFHEFPG